MLHNTLYRMQKIQKTTLTFLLILFLVVSVIWFIIEWYGCKFPMEPVVVFIGGTATLFASFWPWKPTYANQRHHGRQSFDYMTNNHTFTIGTGDRKFTLRFSKASDRAIYMYSDPSDIKAIALVKQCGQISDIGDASSLNYSTRDVCPKEGEIVCLRNDHDCYAAIQIHDVRDASRNDAYDEVTFSYVINPVGKLSFSEVS